MKAKLLELQTLYKSQLAESQAVLKEAKAAGGDVIDFALSTTALGSDAAAKEEYFNQGMARMKEYESKIKQVQNVVDADDILGAAQKKWDTPVSPTDPVQSGAVPSGHLVLQKGLTEFSGLAAKLDKVAMMNGIDIETTMKALFTFAAGWPYTGDLENIVVPAASPMPTIVMAIPHIPLNQNNAKYMEQTTRTSAAAERDAGAAAAESTFVYTQRDKAAKSYAHYVPVIDEILEDAPMTEFLISNDLTLGVQQKLDSEIIVQTEAAVTGATTQAKGTDTVIDAIMKAKTKIMTQGQTMANLLIMHPNDVQELVLDRAITAAAQEGADTHTFKGQYLLADPNMSPNLTPWGLRLLVTTLATENTAYLGDYARYFHVRDRRSFRVSYGKPANMFLEQETAIMGDVRAALYATRATAFGKVTGI